MKKLSKKEITNLIIEHENIMATLDTVKPLYRRQDEITLLLIGQNIADSGWAVVDNYADKNTCFKLAAIKRFELKKVA